MRERVVVAVSASDPRALAELIESVRRRGFTRFATPEGLAPEPPVEGVELWSLGEERFRPVGAPEGRAAVPILEVGAPEELGPALGRGRRDGAVALKWADDRVIPLENAIASRPGGVDLWVFVERPEHLSGALGALEHGAERAVVRVGNAEELHRLEAALEASHTPALVGEFVPVTRVEPVGLGDRVLVDTTSLLEPTEGLLVGSQAALLFHVNSEAVGSKFTRPRPFRVNAGAAHSYVLLSDGTTRYLSELSAGDALRTVRPNGEGRSVRVGRLKVERRPLVLVAVERGGRPYTVFLQEAETVRLSTPEGPVATTALRVGQRVAAVPLPAARHLGVAVDETIEER